MGICDERCLFPKNSTICCFVFSSVFETPLFRLTNRRTASKLQTWWKKEDAGRGTLTNWYVFAQLSQKFWGRIWILISYTKRNDKKDLNIKDESFECLILKSSNLLAFGLVGFLFGLILTLCFCCFVDAKVEKKNYWSKAENLKNSKIRSFHHQF